MTGRSRGFGFVEMSTPEEAAAAIEQLNGKEFAGRNLTVNEARPRTDRGPGNYGNRGGGGVTAVAAVVVTAAVEVATATVVVAAAGAVAAVMIASLAGNRVRTTCGSGWLNSEDKKASVRWRGCVHLDSCLLSFTV